MARHVIYYHVCSKPTQHNVLRFLALDPIKLVNSTTVTATTYYILATHFSIQRKLNRRTRKTRPFPSKQVGSRFPPHHLLCPHQTDILIKLVSVTVHQPHVDVLREAFSAPRATTLAEELQRTYPSSLLHALEIHS